MPQSFWRGVFSESDGTPSFSRVATAVIVAFAVGWVTALVRLNHQLPDFGGLVLLIGALYGVNKVAGAMGTKDRLPGPTGGRDNP
jgi:ABC-type uncharacterized transport system permease subunit